MIGREAILNPEHARAYLVGFFKNLFRFTEVMEFIFKWEGRFYNKQESINILVEIFQVFTGGL